MNVEDLGKFYLIDENETQYCVNYGANLVCVVNNDIVIGEVVEKPDSLFIVNWVKDEVHVIKAQGDVVINGEFIETREICDNVFINVGNVKLLFKFVCEPSKLENLIDLYMDGNLRIKLDMDRLFYEYAQKLKLTDKKAISNVMAAIDIPEIDIV